MLAKLIKKEAIENLIVSERMKVYEASYKFNIENAPEYSYFLNIIHSISKRDGIRITLQDDNERFFDFSGGAASEEMYTGFIEDALGDEIVEVRIKIDKEIKENYFSIYDFEEFAKDLLSLSIEDVMASFSGLFKESPSFLVFDVFSPMPMFTTKTMFFLPHGNGMINSDFNRMQRIESCKEGSYFYNFDVYEILPDDFKINIDYPANPLSGIFQKITTLLSISFIATSSTVNESQLKGIINGQRTMEFCCDINSLPDNKILYRIYNWIYTDGNSIDKAMIARNVISLHCKYVPISEIDDKVMASIQSNYNLYLRDNVKEYLELKNKVAEFISDTVSKTGEYATNLLDKFKSNIIAIFGFMFTVILANIVSDQPLDNLFTKEITILIECVLAGSFVYLVICYLQSRYEIQKVYDSYEQLKRNYNGILTEDDLLEIFGNDEVMRKMKKTISRSEKLYLVIWIVFLVAALIIIEMISASPSYWYVFNLIRTATGNGG